MIAGATKLAASLRAGQTIYVVDSDWPLTGRATWAIHTVRVLSDKAPAPPIGQIIEAAPRRWLAAKLRRLGGQRVFATRRQAERSRKTRQAIEDRHYLAVLATRGRKS